MSEIEKLPSDLVRDAMMIEAQMFADSLLANTAQSEEVWIDSQMGVLKSHEAESARRGMLGPDEYDQKYRSLSHTYYRREWFAQRTGANVRSLEVFDGCVPNYAQNRFRFGVMMRISQ